MSQIDFFIVSPVSLDLLRGYVVQPRRIAMFEKSDRATQQLALRRDARIELFFFASVA